MPRRKTTPQRTFYLALQIGLGVAILAGLPTHLLARLDPLASLRVGTTAGLLAAGLWLARPLLAWLFGKEGAIHLSRARAPLGGLLIALLVTTGVGVLARYGAALPAETSLRLGGIAGAIILALWLTRPLLRWARELTAPLLQRLARRLRDRRATRPPRTAPAAQRESEWGRRALLRLSPRAFEELCAAVAEGWGYRARAVGESGDGGIDLEMWRAEEYVVGQCKRYKGTVPISHVRDFYGAMMHVGAARGYFFTTGRFSDGAYDFVRGKAIELVDGDYLERILARQDAGPAA